MPYSLHAATADLLALGELLDEVLTAAEGFELEHFRRLADVGAVVGGWLDQATYDELTIESGYRGFFEAAEHLAGLAGTVGELATDMAGPAVAP